MLKRLIMPTTGTEGYRAMVPRIDDRLMRSAAFIYAAEDDALLNSRSGGSAFITSVPTADGSPLRQIVAVTNSHVIASGGRTVKFFEDGNIGWHVEDVDPDRWTHAVHDDLAVAVLEHPRAAVLDLLPWEDILPTQERLDELNVGLGDDLIMVHRLAAQARPEHQPVFAFGNIASWPAEPTIINNVERDVFLVEMRSRAGSSGSPVFAHVPPGSYRGHGVMGDRPATMMPFFEETIGLIGIVSGHIDGHAAVIERATGNPTELVATGQSNLALVVPWDRVRALVEETLLDD